MKHVVLHAGHLYQPFWTMKIRPVWQEGLQTAKIGYFWRYKNCSADPIYDRGFAVLCTEVPWQDNAIGACNRCRQQLCNYLRNYHLSNYCTQGEGTAWHTFLTHKRRMVRFWLHKRFCLMPVSCHLQAPCHFPSFLSNPWTSPRCHPHHRPSLRPCLRDVEERETTHQESSHTKQSYTMCCHKIPKRDEINYCALRGRFLHMLRKCISMSLDNTPHVWNVLQKY